MKTYSRGMQKYFTQSMYGSKETTFVANSIESFLRQKWAQASLGSILVSSLALIKDGQEFSHNRVYEGEKGAKSKKEAWETFGR